MTKAEKTVIELGDLGLGGDKLVVSRGVDPKMVRVRYQVNVLEDLFDLTLTPFQASLLSSALERQKEAIAADFNAGKLR